MKKPSRILLGIIATLLLTSCEDANYVKCLEIQEGGHFYGTYETYQIIGKYKSDSEFGSPSIKQADDGAYYCYFFTYYEKGEKEPAFPKYIDYTGSRTYFGEGEPPEPKRTKFTLVSKGMYKSYSTCYLSKDKKKVKEVTSIAQPVSSKDPKLEEGYGFMFYYDSFGKETATYSAGCEIFYLEPREKTTNYYDADDDVTYTLYKDRNKKTN